MPDLAAALEALARPGELFGAAGDGAVTCLACGHRCLVEPGLAGRCRMRFNRAGTLFVPWGYTTGLSADPVEKKPFYHVNPGSIALSFGMLGCNFRCEFCQNWVSSQALRDERAGAPPRPVTPEAIVEAALASGARTISSTYNEPLISAEWARRIFTLARAKGLSTSFVSNGHATPEALEYLLPALDHMNVDLKCFREESYRRLGGRLEPVLDTIRRLAAAGVWLEVITLVVPGFNDGEAELGAIADFLVSVSPDIPWHLSAYYGAYRHAGRGRTPLAKLRAAAARGRSAGLKFIYLGNVAGAAPEYEDTACPGCGAGLVERRGYQAAVTGLAGGACRACGEKIPGRWD